jgi:hypothetical protein
MQRVYESQIAMDIEREKVYTELYTLPNPNGTRIRNKIMKK